MHLIAQRGQPEERHALWRYVAAAAISIRSFLRLRKPFQLLRCRLRLPGNELQPAVQQERSFRLRHIAKCDMPLKLQCQ